MDLKIIGEPNIDFFTDLQKLATKHNIAIMTAQQKKKKTFPTVSDVWIKIKYGYWRTK